MDDKVEDDKAEHRNAARRRVLKAGVITFNNRYVTYNCTIRDLSDTGARLRVDDVTVIPASFELVIDLDGFEAACEVTWRRQHEIGVKFTSPPRKTAPRRAQIVSVVRPEQKPTLRRKT